MGEGHNDAVTPARTFATLAGGALILFGLSGLFYSSSFATGDSLVAEKEFGLFYVNGWQNLLHLAAGVLGLAMVGRRARLYCLASGAIWLLLAAGGFFGSHGGEDVPSMGGLIPAGTANNLLNLLLGGLALAALAASAPARAKSSAPRTDKRLGRDKKKEKPSKKAEKQPKSKPLVEPEVGSTIGRPRSATRVKRPQRGPIN